MHKNIAKIQIVPPLYPANVLYKPQEGSLSDDYSAIIS